MSNFDQAKEIGALRELALEDLRSTSDQELRDEAAEEGIDIEASAVSMKASMRDAAAAVLRGRMAAAKSNMLGASTPKPAGLVRPAIDRVKLIVQQAFQRDDALGLAFRDGKRQSDADWMSLYDDLVSLGKIEPESDAS